MVRKRVCPFASSIFIESGSEVYRLRYEMSVGNVDIHVGVRPPVGLFHFGGRNGLLFGDLHTQGEDAVAFYTAKTMPLDRWFECTRGQRRVD